MTDLPFTPFLLRSFLSERDARLGFVLVVVFFAFRGETPRFPFRTVRVVGDDIARLDGANIGLLTGVDFGRLIGSGRLGGPDTGRLVGLFCASCRRKYVYGLNV